MFLPVLGAVQGVGGFDVLYTLVTVFCKMSADLGGRVGWFQ